jgi:hypothetical protein
MKKFDFADANTKPRLEIEIARAFVNPMKFYLNRFAYAYRLANPVSDSSTRPLIQILEFLAVTPENLLKFQKAALDDIGKCRDSMKGFLNTLRTHDLGKGFSLGQTLKNLLQLTSTSNEGQQTGLDSSTVFGPFVRSLVDYAVVHTLREIKYKARIPIPNSYHLVGVADEGWRLYKQHRGQRKVRVLKDRQIFGACSCRLSCTIVKLTARSCYQRSRNSRSQVSERSSLDHSKSKCPSRRWYALKRIPITLIDLSQFRRSTRLANPISKKEKSAFSINWSTA